MAFCQPFPVLNASRSSRTCSWSSASQRFLDVRRDQTVQYLGANRSSWFAASPPIVAKRPSAVTQRRSRREVVTGFFGNGNKEVRKKVLQQFRRQRSNSLPRQRRPRRGVGADTILVELIRWWIKVWDAKVERDTRLYFSQDTEREVEKALERDETVLEEMRGDTLIEDPKVQEKLLTDSVEILEKEILENDKDKFDLPYSEFPMSLRAGLSINSDDLASKFVVIVADLLCDLIVWDMFHKIHSIEDLAQVLTGASLAYIFGDLVSGVYHWVRHNFESLGFDLDREDTECDREICEAEKKEVTKDFYKSVASHCLAAVPFLAVLWIAPHDDLTMQSFGVYILTIVSILPAFKQWATTKTPPRAVSVLQRAGLMLRKSEKAISDAEYCLVSGFWNKFLSGTKFFTFLEHLIVYISQGKIVPKSWNGNKDKQIEKASDTCSECGEESGASSSGESCR